MDASTLKAAGFSNEEVAEYTGLKSAGFTDAEIDAHYSGQPAPVAEKPQPAQWKKTVSNIADYALPTAGAIGAEVLALPATIASGPFAPATAVGAGTAGWMAGKSGARGLKSMFGISEDKGIVDEVNQSLTQDLPEGAIGSMGGMLGIKGVKETGKYIGNKVVNSKLPERLWTSAAKPSMGGKLSVKDARVGTALKEGISPDRAGLERANSKIAELNAEVDDIISSASQGTAVNRDSVLSNLDKLRSFYKNAQNPEKYLPIIDDVAEQFRATHDQFIPAAQAQKMKQATYAIHKKAYNPNVTPGLDTEAEKNIAQGLMKELEGVLPAVKVPNKKQGALIDLLKVVEPAVSRVENSNLVGLGTPMTSAVGGAIGGAPGALGAGVAKAIAEDPSNKAKLAIWLAKKRGVDLGRAITPNSLEELLMGGK